MKKFKIIAFMLALLMILSLASCKNDVEPAESGPNESGESSETVSSEITEETTAEEKISALDLIIRAEEIADGYNSAVETVSYTIKMGDTVSSAQTSVTKKNGNDVSYTVTADGNVNESIILKDGKINYYRDAYGAFKLTDATLDDFDKLTSPEDSDVNPFDFENRENYTDGSVTETADGYDFTLEFSDKGKDAIVKSFDAPEGYTVKADKLVISGKIDKEGNAPEMKFEMVITLSASGVSVTMNCESTMTLTEIGEDVKLDSSPAGIGFVDFGSAADFIKYIKASSKHAELANSSTSFASERELNFDQRTAAGAKPFALTILSNSSFDPAKGANYSIHNKTYNSSAEYYSNLIEVIVKESEDKIHVDPSIKHENILSAILTDLYATELGTLYCDKVISIKDGKYTFSIADNYAKSIVAAYISNNFGADIVDVSIAGARYIVEIGEDGNYKSISIEIETGFTYANNSCVVTINDRVSIIGYGTAEIVPLVPAA